jgi:hypothetical protein
MGKSGSSDLETCKKIIMETPHKNREVLLGFASHLNNYKGLENLRFDFMVIDYLEKNNQGYFKNCGGCGKLVEKDRWILKTEVNIKDHYRPICKDCAIWAELPVY